VLNLRHISVPRPVEGGGREYQDCPVDEQSEHERNTRIDRGELDRFAFAFERLLELASLHNGRVQVKVMRHHGRTKDADADIEHSRICNNVRTGNKSEQDAGNAGFGEKKLGSETTSDGGDKRDHNGLDVTKALG